MRDRSRSSRGRSFMLTKAEYIALMRHAIGGSDGATGHDLDQTFQRAGQTLFGRYSWPWLINDPITLAATAGQNTINLPADFQELVRITNANNPYVPVVLATPDFIHERRTLPLRDWVQHVAVMPWRSQATPAVPPTPILMLDRTPTTSGDPTFSVMYRRGWVEVVDDNAVPNMPPDMQNALVYLCRSMAWAMENDTEHPDAARADDEMKDQFNQFGRSQRVLGQIRGGAGDRFSRAGVSRAFPPGFVVP